MAILVGAAGAGDLNPERPWRICTANEPSPQPAAERIKLCFRLELWPWSRRPCRAAKTGAGTVPAASKEDRGEA